MLIVPVIDLRRGEVVHAVRGERAAYRPIRSRLVAGSEPVAVARALLDASGSDTLYIADLDALLGEPPQRAAWRALRDALPGVALWLDAGFGDASSAHAATAPLAATTPVLGTESASTPETLAGRSDVFLSLDQRRGQPLDGCGWWHDSARWPQRVIVMNLDRVGAGAGPDLQAFVAQRRRAPERRFIGAGGVRDRDDVVACAAAGAAAWLVASGLHDGRLAIESRRGTALATDGER